MDEEDGKKVICQHSLHPNTGVRLIMRMLSVSYLPEDCSSPVDSGAPGRGFYTLVLRQATHKSQHYIGYLGLQFIVKP